MSWSFEAWPIPLWFHQESEHPPTRSDLRSPPSVARPFLNWFGGDPNLAEGQIFGRSAKSSSWAATGLLSPQPQTLSPMCQ